MDRQFWHQKWKKNEIGFHQNEVHPMLISYFKELALAGNGRVFLPLCGKTRDISWLLSQGYCVAGAELSEIAVEQLFIDLGLEPTISSIGAVKRYSAKDIDIFVGDIFDLTRETMGPIDAIYDRAALVALPEQMRKKYSAHLMKLTNQSPQLLICFEYDQALMAGPPFSIHPEELNSHYSDHYDVTRLSSKNVPGKLKGKCVAKESVWLLR